MSQDYRDRLAAQLKTAAERELAPRLAAKAAGRSARRSLGLTAIAVLVISGGTATALTVAANDPDDPYDPVPIGPRASVPAKVTPLSAADLARLGREREARSPKVDASRYFAVLRAPQKQRDRSGAPERYAQETRLAYRGPGGRGRVYIRATDREVCIYSYAGKRNGYSSSCIATVLARRDGVYGFAECLKDPPQRRRLSGVVPDGVVKVTAYRDGELQATATVQRNGFVLDTGEPIDEVRVGRSVRRVAPVIC